MDMIRQFIASKRNTLLVVIVVFVSICTVLGALCFQYYHHLQDTVKTETSGYLREISKQISVNASKMLQDNFAVLKTVESALKTARVSTYKQFQMEIREQRENWVFENIMLIDGKGIAYDAWGRTVSLGGPEYLREAVVDRKPSMTVSQVIGDRERAVFIIPVDGLAIDGISIVALAASYDVSTFDQILSMSAFGGQGYAHMIRKDGSVVVRSSSENAVWTGYNLLSSLAESKIEDGRKIEDIKNDFERAQDGQVEFKLGNVHDYMVYTPLEKKEWVLATFVPVSVVNAKSDLLLRLTLILCSGITVLFSLLIAILTLSFYRHKRKLEDIAYVDPITGGYTMQRFFELAKAVLHDPEQVRHVLIYTNIEKFKVLNEQFGRPICDSILCGIQSGVSRGLRSKEYIGRLSADNFCIFAQYENENVLIDRLGIWYEKAIEAIGEHGFHRPVGIEFGIYVIENETIPLPQMLDRAKLALREPTRKFKGKLRYSVYDETVRHRIFREKQLEDCMEEALKNREFQVYLQPKYRTIDESIGGAEALVRWVNSPEGMIYPDEFIPLFEKNGFIIQLDLWVFEEVCRTIRKWIDTGRSLVPISVNCSRVQLKNPYFFSRYREICEKYKIPTRLLEIELTETVVFEDAVNLSQVIRNIKEAGFSCSMDDFGSGYSSLNLIQDIPVNTLKIDRIFFRTAANDLKRAESVIGGIITMAKALDMLTVAEGVEERMQVDMLKRLGCDYIQGYYFATPMPIAKFEQLLFGEEPLDSEKGNDPK